jgi:hypothetical protein
MKKLVMGIATCLLLAPGFATAKDTTYKGEIMDSACAEGGGHESMFKKMGTNDAKACTEACVKGVVSMFCSRQTRRSTNWTTRRSPRRSPARR